MIDKTSDEERLRELRELIERKSEFLNDDDDLGDCSLMTDIYEYQQLYFKD